LSRLEKEVEALRVAAPLLSEDKEAGNDNKPTLAATATQQPIRIPQPAVNTAPQAARAAGGKTPPSAGPSRGVGERPVACGRPPIDLARSLAPGYNFLGTNGGASARLVLTETRGRQPRYLTYGSDRVGLIESIMSARDTPPRASAASAAAFLAIRLPFRSISRCCVRERPPAFRDVLSTSERRRGGGVAAELQLGEWVAVEFQLPNASQSLQTKAVVRHHNQLRCGFEFLDSPAISDR